MDLVVKKIKPLMNQIITTAWEEEVPEQSGIIINTEALKRGVDSIQRVVAIGGAVKEVKEGDLIDINYSRYAVRKYKKDTMSIKDDMDEHYRDQIVRYDIPSIVVDGVSHLRLYDNDVNFIISEYEEIKKSQIIDCTPKIIIV
jgi:co-chaperonin GroES (HSP10)